MESVFDFLSYISDGRTFSFVFALLMNFIILFFIFCLNLASVVVTELVQALETKRTGGYRTNELELNSLVTSARTNHGNISQS